MKIIIFFSGQNVFLIVTLTTVGFVNGMKYKLNYLTITKSIVRKCSNNIKFQLRAPFLEEV